MSEYINPGGDSEPQGPPGELGFSKDAAEELEFNVGAIRAIKGISATIAAGEYGPTPEFCARLAELNGVCALYFNPKNEPEGDDGEEAKAESA